MPKNRVVLTFSATPGGSFSSLSGWSETLWRNVDEAPDTLLNQIVGTPGVPPTIPYLLDRRALMTPGWRIDGVKVYPITGGRIVAQATLSGDSGKGLFLLSADETEQQPYDRLLWKMNATGGHSRSCRLGGIASIVVDPGGNYSSPIEFNAELRSVFFAHLVSSQFGMRFATVSDPVDIINVVTDTATIPGASVRTPVIVFSGDQSAVFAAGKVVRVSNCTSPARLNGQWTVGTVAVVGGETRAKLRAKRSLQITGDYQIGAFARSFTFDVAAMTSGSPIRGVSRRAGRPSGLPRGRRSRRT